MTPNLQIEYRPIDALLPYARNPRTHSPAQIAKIAASIVEFGWTQPILADGESGIIAGTLALPIPGRAKSPSLPSRGRVEPTQIVMLTITTMNVTMTPMNGRPRLNAKPNSRRFTA